MKERIIFLDGMDKTGKTSIKRELVKYSDGKYLVVDRSFTSQIAYSIINDRKIDGDFFIRKSKEIFDLGDCSFVYVTTNNDEISKRIIYCNEEDITQNDVEKHKIVFENVVKTLNLIIPIHTIDTTNKTAEESAKAISEEIEKLDIIKGK